MTTNIELGQELKHLKKYRGCIMRDQVNKKLKNGYYVVNMDDSTGEGTHWCGLLLTTYQAIYCDPFGIHPPEELKTLKRPKRKVYYNSDQLQDKMSDTCGQWCIAFINHMYKNNDYQSFLDQFTDDTIKNERILLKIC